MQALPGKVARLSIKEGGEGGYARKIAPLHFRNLRYPASNA
jgi:hypothetical protein